MTSAHTGSYQHHKTATAQRETAAALDECAGSPDA